MNEKKLRNILDEQFREYQEFVDNIFEERSRRLDSIMKTLESMSKEFDRMEKIFKRISKTAPEKDI